MAHELSGRPPTVASDVPHDLLERVRRFFLVATLVVSAAIPWYTLRMLPIFSFGTAKVNLLDVLVGSTFLMALPNIMRGIRKREPAVLWVCAFLIAMIVPLLKGLLDPDGTLLAVREARALAFYAIALVLATEGFEAKAFRTLAAAYAIAAAAAAGAVLAHVYWGVPIPGYEDALLRPEYGTQSIAQVAYLQLSVVVIGFALSFYGVLTSRWSMRAVWAGCVILLAWYVLAAAERFAQVLTIVATVILVVQTSRGRRVHRSQAVLGTILVIVVALGLASATNARIGAWTRYAAFRWSRTFTDGSIEYRVRETIAGLSVEGEDPLFGNGLGTSIPMLDPGAWWADRQGRADLRSAVPWNYVSSGYGFLLIRTGVIGLLLYLAMFWAAFQAAREQLRRPADAGRWPSAAIGGTGLMILLIANVLNPIADVPESVIAFGMFYGMMVSDASRRRAGGA